MKTCCKCKENKELTEFCSHKKTKDGLNYACKKCCSENYFKNKDKNAAKRREYRERMKGEVKARRAEYFKAHRKEKSEYDKEYRKQNKLKIALYKKEWEKELKDDPLFKIKRNLRRRIHHALMGEDKSARTVELLGCSIEDFMKHLESKFVDGMNWENYGKNGWHVDHIIPCVAFDLTKESEQRKCFHYTNTQPLWEGDNLKKSYIFEGLNCRAEEGKEIMKAKIIKS